MPDLFQILTLLVLFQLFFISFFLSSAGYMSACMFMVGSLRNEPLGKLAQACSFRHFASLFLETIEHRNNYFMCLRI